MINRHNPPPEPHLIRAGYDSLCILCGKPIKAGQLATFYPKHTVANMRPGIAHVGELEKQRRAALKSWRKNHPPDGG